jgi:hypothetical protein
MNKVKFEMLNGEVSSLTTPMSWHKTEHRPPTTDAIIRFARIHHKVTGAVKACGRWMVGILIDIFFGTSRPPPLFDPSPGPPPPGPRPSGATTFVLNGIHRKPVPNDDAKKRPTASPLLFRSPANAAGHAACAGCGPTYQSYIPLGRSKSSAWGVSKQVFHHGPSPKPLSFPRAYPISRSCARAPKRCTGGCTGAISPRKFTPVAVATHTMARHHR